ncbi:MAG: NAD(+) synthase, partial [Firmicutes bacterium]|nr:NAD(+) synthase [Bacillota bacterium]
MKYGFIKVAAITPTVVVADCSKNAAAIAEDMKKAAEAGVQIAVFPELCITGYTCGDLFWQESLLWGANEGLKAVQEASKAVPGLLSFVGVPVLYRQKLYNCAAAVQEGRVLAFVPKKNLNSAELRQFAPAPETNETVAWDRVQVPFGCNILLSCDTMTGLKIGAEIGDDLWVANPPSVGLAEAGASIIVNLSAGYETIGKMEYRRNLVLGQSGRLVCGYVYCNAGDGESTTDYVFAGHNMIAENSVMLSESKPFENGMIVSEVDVQRILFDRRRMNGWCNDVNGYLEVNFTLPQQEVQLTRQVDTAPFIPKNEEGLELILTMQANGLKKRLAAAYASSAVIGISGGLDSTLALLVAVRAADQLGWDRKKIMGITMPCFGTTVRTKSNAELLCDSLGIECKCIDIAESVRVHFQAIGHDESDHSVVFENGQARECTQILMDVANGCNGMVIGTGDLSELALGWATYNGDHMSMYGVNADVP